MFALAWSPVTSPCIDTTNWLLTHHQSCLLQTGHFARECPTNPGGGGGGGGGGRRSYDDDRRGGSDRRDDRDR